MERERIEEFTQNGKRFLYVDLSGFKSNDQFRQQIEAAKSVIAKYPEKSVCTVINIEGISFDSETKEMGVKWMEHNKPYVIFGAVAGVDGIKKIMVKTIFKLSGRKNMIMTSSKEKAIEWLLNQK